LNKLAQGSRQVKEKQTSINHVLDVYLQTHACPCAWPQFRYWVAKERPDGSYDPIQNLLVEAALALPTFLQTPPTRPQYWLEAEVRCSACGTQWLYFCEEWRMLGFHKQLMRTDGRTPDQAVIQAAFERAGSDPLNRLDLEKWVLFIQGQ
jgi:hypothetical protein